MARIIAEKLPEFNKMVRTRSQFRAPNSSPPSAGSTVADAAKGTVDGTFQRGGAAPANRLEVTSGDPVVLTKADKDKLKTDTEAFVPQLGSYGQQFRRILDHKDGALTDVFVPQSEKFRELAHEAKTTKDQYSRYDKNIIE